MATTTTTSCSFLSSFSVTIFLVLVQCYLFSFQKGFALKLGTEEDQVYQTHTVQLTSLLPSTSCLLSTQGLKKEGTASLEVVHKHGPCSTTKLKKSKLRSIPTHTHTQVLLQDQARVNSIHAKRSDSDKTGLSTSKASTLPAKSGTTIGSGNYIVTVGLGSPRKDLSLIFDTGSDLTWTQCQPCVRYCYKQKETIFDPTQSTSYSNISCTSPLCSQLASATRNSLGCSASSCLYAIQYGDQSFSVGFFGKERLTLTSSNVFDGFLFGCGENNRGLFGGAAGLLGLGRNKISIVKQTANKYGQVFSYCLPSTSSATGYLVFGRGGDTAVKYTSFSSNSQSSSFYGIDVVGISVGGRKLTIPASTFSTSGSIIDSGTVITRLPPTAYDALKAEFQKEMKSYPKADAVSILDTCYDLSSYGTISIPKVSFFFSSGVEVGLHFSGILYVVSQKQVCLAFAGNGADSDITIFGNTQQKTLKVVYDVGGGRVGFGAGGCS